ncbi:hypothetical protein MMC13_007952 [Lambiella insularis]|nr:hypothetical protein [Lambiella insularis]
MKFETLPQTPIVLVLVTPSLAGLFDDDDHHTIPNLLCQIFAPGQPIQKVDVVAAVVDRISYPSGIEPSGITQEPVLRGSEGLSILVADSEHVAPHLWSVEHQASEQEGRLEEQQSSVSFKFFSNERGPSIGTPNKQYTIHTLELALANTLFQTGRSSTITVQRWLCKWKESGKRSFVQIRHNAAQQHVLNLCLGELSQGKNRNSKEIAECCIQLPSFCELTPPRVVSEAMGNIVRRLHSSSLTDPAMSASEELERSLISWTDSAENMYEIWARVTPQERWSGLPQVGLPQMLGLPSKFEEGSRLHRVLSGGGGWGNKQGLISLDPDSCVSRPFARDTFGDGEDFEAEQRKALGEVVKPGDVIQFYAFKQLNSPQSRVQKTGTRVGNPCSITFGSIQSQKDAIPSEPTRNEASLDPLVIQGHFGALSETGISLKIQFSFDTTSSYGPHRMGTIVQTKLPPLSSFTWMTKQHSKVPSS